MEAIFIASCEHHLRAMCIGRGDDKMENPRRVDTFFLVTIHNTTQRSSLFRGDERVGEEKIPSGESV